MWYYLFISRHILHQHWFTCPIALPVCPNPQHGSLLTVVSATSAHPIQPVRLSEIFATFLDPGVNRFTWQTLPTAKRKHFFVNILCIELFYPRKKHNIKLLFGSTQVKHGCHFDYRIQPLNMLMRFCYLAIYIVHLNEAQSPVGCSKIKFEWKINPV
jgi:hypothetical protein